MNEHWAAAVVQHLLKYIKFIRIGEKLTNKYSIMRILVHPLAYIQYGTCINFYKFQIHILGNVIFRKIDCVIRILLFSFTQWLIKLPQFIILYRVINTNRESLVKISLTESSIRIITRCPRIRAVLSKNKTF